MASKLKGAKPETVQKKLKLFMYGKAGIGKTMAAISFDRPYVIDTERGAENDQYVKMISDKGGAYLFTTSLDDIIDQTGALLTEKHPYRFLVIDPATVPYATELDESAAKNGTEFGRHKVPVDRKMKHLLTLVSKLDMGVVMTAHAKTNWIRTKDAKGNDTIVDGGITFDAFAKSDYLFDLVLEVQKRGGERIAIVRKSRIEAFPEGSEFPLSYDEIANRYGREILEREAVPVELATPEQVEELTRLLDVRTDGETLKEKWLKKAEAEYLTELPKDIAEKCVAFLREGKKE